MTLEETREPFACPRCGQTASAERFYGPCASCRDELSTRLGEGEDATAPGHDTGREERVHRVPNFVATKD